MPKVKQIRSILSTYCTYLHSTEQAENSIHRILSTPKTKDPAGSFAERHLRGANLLAFAHGFHAQTHPTLAVDLDDFNFNRIAFFDEVCHTLDALVADLRNVQQTVLTW